MRRPSTNLGNLPLVFQLEFVYPPLRLIELRLQVSLPLKLLGFASAEIIALAHQRLLHPFTRRFRICEFPVETFNLDRRRGRCILHFRRVHQRIVELFFELARVLLLHVEIFSHQSQLFLSTV